MDAQFVLFVLVLGLAFANGPNDVSKAIATLVGIGITTITPLLCEGLYGQS